MSLESRYVLAVHGGAGGLLPESIPVEVQLEHKLALEAALRLGEDLLRRGFSALDAVEATVAFLEDCPLFNAGKGSVYTYEGIHEMDAAVMYSHGLRSGAVGGLRGFANPVRVARAVLDQSPYVLLSGEGAGEFARHHGFRAEEHGAFGTEKRRRQWEVLQQQEGAPLATSEDVERKFGTVGAVALDLQGHLAAATSTGGLTNKRYGRLGDSCVIGAGTLANDYCAVSCTGWGEIFITHQVAHRVSMMMECAGMDLETATRQVIHEELAYSHPESGGLIAVDREGNISAVFNTPGMYRGAVGSAVPLWTAIFADEV